MESLGGRPDTTADYGRLAALPIAQGPASITTIGDWLAAARATAAPLIWSHPDEEPLDPGGATERRARGVAATAGEWLLVPSDTPARTIEGAGSTAGDVAVVLPADEWAAVTLERLAMENGESADEFAQRLAGKLHWDAFADAASPLSIPFHPDESLGISYGIAGDSSGMIPADLPGALADSPPDVPHLLATSTQFSGGEVDPQLARAPATGVVRFERYQHLVRADAGGLTLRRPSNDGRLVLRSTPLGERAPWLADAFDDDARIDGGPWIVFEDVEAGSLVEVLPPLLLDQVRRAGSLLRSFAFVVDAGGLGRALRATVTWLLRAWQAAAAIDGELTRVPASVAGELRALVPVGWLPSGRAGDEQLTEACAVVVGDAAARHELTGFATDLFARVAIGDAWSDIGIPLSASDPLDGSDAENELIDCARTFDRWLACFPGCPLGKLGRRWVREDELPVVWDGAAERYPDAAAAHRATFSTFQVEALYQARFGGAGESVADHAQARAAGPVEDVALLGYSENLGLQRRGRAGVLRIVEWEHPKRPFTTLDWIRELARGTTQLRAQLPLLDAQPACDAGHPLAQLLEWETYRVARILRDRMDLLAAHPLRGGTLQDALVAWWLANTKLASGGLWPAPCRRDPVGGGMGLARGVPTPRTPYKPAGKAGAGRDRAVTEGRRHLRNSKFKQAPPILWNVEDGWDDFDLLAAVRAAQVVRDGRTLQAPVHPALVLAVAETEGYRMFGGQNRVPSSLFEVVLDSIALFPRDFRPGRARATEFEETCAQGQWQMWTYGSDILNQARHPPRPNAHAADYVEKAAAQFDFVLGRLANVDWNGDPMQPPVPPAGPGRSILDPGFLASGEPRRFIKSRLRARWTGIGAHDGVELSRLSRRLEWVGLTLEAAIFQWHHRMVSEERGYLFDMLQRTLKPGRRNPEAIVRVPEVVEDPPPDPGADALSDERREYIAYWATVYLAFNATVKIFNDWISEAIADNDAGRPLTEFLLYELDNRTTTDLRAPALGNMTRFALALDAYLRLDYDVDPLDPGPDPAGIDVSDPNLRTWP